MDALRSGEILTEYTRMDEAGGAVRGSILIHTAVEDIKAGDLDGDGRPDIVAAARQTKNLKIFFSGP